MAYVQLSLLNIPAVATVGDSITLEMRESWYASAHIFGGWDRSPDASYPRRRAGAGIADGASC